MSRIPAQVANRPWVPADVDCLRPYARLSRVPAGVIPVLARDLGRTVAAVIVRIAVLRKAMPERNGAEGGQHKVVLPVRVPRVAPSAAAPVSGLDVSSQSLAGAVSPATAGAVPVAAPAGFPGTKREARLRRERQALSALMAELKGPPPEDIARKCCACRAPFRATSRFLFRCEPCRRGSDLPVQYQSASTGGRVRASQHG